MSKRTFALYGVTERDPDNELVCQFFATEQDMNDFKDILPGRYEHLIMNGVSYDDIEVEVVGWSS